MVMHYRNTLLVCIALLACGKKERIHPVPLTEHQGIELLAEKQQSYLAMSASKQDPDSGWILLDSCDALLYNALFSSANGVKDADILRARTASGQWLRRPEGLSCYPTGASSTISKDMLLGLMFWSWRERRLDVVEALASYGVANKWVMGEPFPEMASRVLLTPNLIGLLYRIIYALGGEDHPSRKLPNTLVSGLTGFEAHLQTLNLIVNGEVQKAIDAQDETNRGQSEKIINLLNEHIARSPENPLFRIALGHYNGDQTKAIELLLDEKHWPNGRLPSKAEHCDYWLPSVEPTPNNWEPCGTKDETYPGADFVFMADLILRSKQ